MSLNPLNQVYVFNKEKPTLIRNGGMRRLNPLNQVYVFNGLDDPWVFARFSVS